MDVELGFRINWVSVAIFLVLAIAIALHATQTFAQDAAQQGQVGRRVIDDVASTTRLVSMPATSRAIPCGAVFAMSALLNLKPLWWFLLLLLVPPLGLLLLVVNLVVHRHIPGAITGQDAPG